MKRALRRGAKLIVCDPRKTWLAQRAHIHIQHRPGSDNMLLNAMMRYILDEGLANQAFIESRCEGFEEFRENLQQYTVEAAAKYCGVDAELIRTAARWYAAGDPSAIFYTLGITEHTCGTDNVKNVANLAMLCGQIGKWASGVNPLRGQNNVQGACDMGAMAQQAPRLPGRDRPRDARQVREGLGRGAAAKQRRQSARTFSRPPDEGELKALYIMGEDLVATEPNNAKVIEHLRNLEFFVVQEIFLTETAKLAHVVLPGACWAEKDGTFTASERRMQLVRKAVEPPGEARAGLADPLRRLHRDGLPDAIPKPGANLRRDGRPVADLCRHQPPADRRSATACNGHARRPTIRARASSTKASSHAAKASSTPSLSRRRRRNRARNSRSSSPPAAHSTTTTAAP